MSEIYATLAEKQIQTELLEVNVPGIGLLKVKSIDRQKAFDSLRYSVSKDITSIKYAQRIFPIDFLVESKLNEMIPIFSILTKKINANESWRVSVKKRHTNIKSAELINSVVSQSDNTNISLDNPDKILRIEIIGKITGIALHSPKEEIKFERN